MCTSLTVMGILQQEHVPTNGENNILQCCNTLCVRNLYVFADYVTTSAMKNNAETVCMLHVTQVLYPCLVYCSCCFLQEDSVDD